MSLPKEPFSWDDDPDESPVPLGDGVAESPQGDGIDPAAAVVEQAEVLVREAQDAIARQDTDPAIPLSVLAMWSYGFPSRAAGERGNLKTDPRSRWRALRTVCVATACAVAFAHGWHQGAIAAANEAGEPRSSMGLPNVSQSTVQGSLSIDSGRR